MLAINLVINKYPIKCRLRVNHDADAILLNISRRHLRTLFYDYLRSGRNKFSLVDHRKGNYRKRVPHSKDYENPKNDVDEIGTMSRKRTPKIDKF